MDKTTIIKIEDAIPRIDTLKFRHPINWSIKENEHWAIIGPNGAGKTLFTDILTGKHALKSGKITNCYSQSISSLIKCVAFRDIYSLTDVQNSYYQQRWNSGDEHEAPTVRNLFSGNRDRIEHLISTFRIEDLINKPINLLSSGELRKALIVRSLLTQPKILILDNPFIGLDTKSRILLNQILNSLSQLDDLQIILVLSNPKDIPETITHVLPIKDKTLLSPITRSEFIESQEVQNLLFDRSKTTNIDNLLKNIYDNTSDISFENALSLRNIHIQYGDRVILKDLNWSVKRGEKWALLGENGSGKSTLLSLIAGDNPQAYANDITLFDRKRGSGESIWDIKKHIGYISPEMHLYYLKNVRCLDIVGSGFFDTIGLYRKCSPEQEKIAIRWMETLGIDNIKDVSFLNVSTGEQRLVLLARVFVKNPDLLILDEPLHGLDITNKEHIRTIIEEFCNNDKTLIYVTHYEDEIPGIVSKRLQLTKQI